MFYGNLGGYLILNPVYTNISNLICKWIETVGNIFKQARAHLFAHS